MSTNTEMTNALLDVFINTYSIDYSVVLLQIVAPQENGGRGYKIRVDNPLIDLDGWDVDHKLKVITIDYIGFFSNNSLQDLADALKDAIEVEFMKTRPGLLPRLSWGTGKVILGVAETAVGVVGIIVPEPGTTVGGIICVTLGTNTIIDGVSQIAGANNGNGVNLLGETAGYVGTQSAEFFNIDPTTGYNIGKTAFVVFSVAAGSLASMKIVFVPGKVTAGFGIANQPGGVYLGRLNGLYQSKRAVDGMTILNINNNAGQSILRFVTHGGKLMVNGRIVGQSRVLQHSTDAREILRGLIKLLAHGAKF